jgi:hypothetical protein
VADATGATSPFFGTISPSGLVSQESTSFANPARPVIFHRQGARMEKLPVDPAAVESAISDIVEQIQDEEDPILMTRYKRLFRKYTTLFNRGYVSAFLLKKVVEAGRSPSRKKRGGEKPSQQSSDGHQSIFVSIGRNRRVHTRDLITFFTSAEGVTRDDIGQIKVLDNYSFVEVNAEKAQAAIDALNGTELRGRKLTVNFARRK